MNKPSVKTLSQCFDDPKAARRIFEMSRTELLECPQCAALDDAWCANAKTWQLRLEALNTEGSFHGIEACETSRRSNGYSADEYAEYLNAGDSYAATVIYWRGHYRVQSIGEFIERSRIAFA